MCLQLLGFGGLRNQRYAGKTLPGTLKCAYELRNSGISLNRYEPAGRQRFSLAHEFKHVLDAPFGDSLYPEWRGLGAGDRAEQVANHFAACLLMPKAWVRRTYFNRGVMSVPRLAASFEVSQTAMRYRLESLGLIQPILRCGIREAA